MIGLSEAFYSSVIGSFDIMMHIVIFDVTAVTNPQQYRPDKTYILFTNITKVSEVKFYNAYQCYNEHKARHGEIMS